MRCFDRNFGRSFDLPKRTPDGVLWTELSDDDLRSLAIKKWRLLPEFHKAIAREVSCRGLVLAS